MKGAEKTGFDRIHNKSFRAFLCGRYRQVNAIKSDTIAVQIVSNSQTTSSTLLHDKSTLTFTIYENS